MNVWHVKSKQRCVNCGSDEFVIFYTNQRTFELINSEKLIFNQELENCYKCGLVRQADNESYSDENLNKYYENTFRTPTQVSEIDRNDKRVINALKRLDFIKRIKPNGTLLEVGFGDGIFLAEASSSFQCSGIDLSDGYLYVHEFLRSKQVEVFHGQLDDFSQQKKFDVVCAFLVLEHIKQPLQFIAKLKRHLLSNGILVIEVPDIESYKSFNSESLLTHEHVYHYTTKTLANLLAKENLKLIDATNTDVSYGFSLIASFALINEEISNVLSSGFHSIALFQDFLQIRLSYKQKMQKNLAEIIQRVKEIGGRIAVYGTGFLFAYAVENCKFDLRDIDYLFDETTEKLGKKNNDKSIMHIKEIENLNINTVIIFSEMFFEVMKDNLLNFAKDKEIEIINIHQLSL